MSYSHSTVYIVRIVDADSTETDTWFVGPYGRTRADQTARHLEAEADADDGGGRTCFVEPLFSDDECLGVVDYGGGRLR